MEREGRMYLQAILVLAIEALREEREARGGNTLLVSAI